MLGVRVTYYGSSRSNFSGTLLSAKKSWFSGTVTSPFSGISLLQTTLSLIDQEHALGLHLPVPTLSNSPLIPVAIQLCIRQYCTWMKII